MHPIINLEKKKKKEKKRKKDQLDLLESFASVNRPGDAPSSFRDFDGGEMNLQGEGRREPVALSYSTRGAARREQSLLMIITSLFQQRGGRIFVAKNGGGSVRRGGKSGRRPQNTRGRVGRKFV